MDAIARTHLATSKTGRRARAPAVHREHIRNVNAAWKGISRCRLYIMQISGQELLPDIMRAQDWHVVYYSMRGLFDGK